MQLVFGTARMYTGPASEAATDRTYGVASFELGRLPNTASPARHVRVFLSSRTAFGGLDLNQSKLGGKLSFSELHFKVISSE